MLIWPEIKIILIIAIMLLIPGWAFLAVSGLWQRYKGLQGWFLAVGISIAFYPILFYTARTILPNLRIGETKLTVLLILMLGLTLWLLRKSCVSHLRSGSGVDWYWQSWERHCSHGLFSRINIPTRLGQIRCITH